MSLENEYYHEKEIFEKAQEELKKFESLDTSQMTEEQLKSHQRGIRFLKEDIEESKEILAEIEEEMKEGN